MAQRSAGYDGEHWLDFSCGLLADSLQADAALIIALASDRPCVIARAGRPDPRLDGRVEAWIASADRADAGGALDGSPVPGALWLPIRLAGHAGAGALLLVRGDGHEWTAAERAAAHSAAERIAARMAENPAASEIRSIHPLEAPSREHYQRLVDSSPYGIFVIDAEARFAEANPALLRMLAREPDELLGQPFADVIAQSDRAKVVDYFQLRLQGYQGERDYEAQLQLRSGEVRTAHIRTVSIVQEGRAIGAHGVVRDVTTERQAQTTLRELQQRLSATLEGISDAFLIVNRDLQFTYVNARASHVLGIPAHELLGIDLTAILPPPLAREMRDLCRRAGDTQRPRRLELFVPQWDRWAEIRVYPTPEQLSIFLTDISHTKSAEAERQQREREFRALVENSPDIIARHDRDLRLVYVSPSVERELGVSPTSLMGRTPAELRVPHALADEWARTLRTVLSSGREESVELALPAGGAIRHFDCRVTPEFDSAGEVASLLSVGRDISEQKRAETLLRESESRFRSLVEQPLVGIYIMRQGRTEYVNPYCADVFGYEPERLIADGGIAGVVLEDDRPIVEDLLRRRMAGDRTGSHCSFRARRTDGRIVAVEADATLTMMDGEPTIIGVLLDVTERKQAELQLREREERLRHSQKLEAVGQLAGGIAHDFNNLLMVILGTTNLMLVDLPEDHPHQADLVEILRATDRATALTRQLLAFSRKQVLRPKVVHLNDAVDKLQKMMVRVIGEDVELVTQLEPGLGCVRVDPGQLEQVILNLLVNSRDAMPDGGRLTIETTNAELTAGDASRFPYRVIPGPYVRVSVVDTGYGMDMETLSKVYEPFFTTKEQGKGTGLGLSMVYGIVKQSGGYIWTSSSPGAGTRVDIFLPAVDAPVETEATMIRAILPKGSGTVLLVEDEEPVRSTARRILQRSGYTVLEAASGWDALQRSSDFPDTIDLLLTDVVMPEMDGRELVTRLRVQRPGLKVLYMSGYAQDRIFQQGWGQQPDDFLAKPFPPEQLVQRVQALLTGA